LRNASCVLGRPPLTAAVVVAAALAGCGGSGDDQARCDSKPEAAVGLRALPAGDTAVSDGAVDFIVSRLCSRPGPKLQVRATGGDGLEVGSAERPGTADLLAALAPRRLAFYDWEPNVYGDPDQPTISTFEAVSLAAKQKPRNELDDRPDDRANDTSGDKYYLFDADRELVLPGAAVVGDEAARALQRDYFTSCTEVADDVRAAQPAIRPARVGPPAAETECAPELGAAKVEKGTRVLKVPRGIVLIAAEAQPGEDSLGWFVVEDDTELTSGNLEDPRQRTDPQTNEPIVTFEFDDEGRAAFARVTKREAERGAQQLRPPGVPIENTFQRFAITLDNQIVSLATINYQENPEGIDGSSGAQINGIGDLRATRELAEALSIGPLPLDLQVVSAP
jgi:SecD/SecF fusion protein